LFRGGGRLDVGDGTAGGLAGAATCRGCLGRLREGLAPCAVMSMRVNPSFTLKFICDGLPLGPVIFMVTLPSKEAAESAPGTRTARRKRRTGIFFMRVESN
jgi:hypothetical protein